MFSECLRTKARNLVKKGVAGRNAQRGNIIDYSNNFIEWLNFISKDIIELNSKGTEIINDPKIQSFMKYSLTEYDGRIIEAVDIFMKGPGLEIILHKFKNISPLLMWSEFAMEQSYNALDWLLSYKRILQQNEVSGQETEAATYMQQKINDTFDLMKDCK